MCLCVVVMKRHLFEKSKRKKSVLGLFRGGQEEVVYVDVYVCVYVYVYVYVRVCVCVYVCVGCSSSGL